MQDLIVIVIVSIAAAYAAWALLPVRWRPSFLRGAASVRHDCSNCPKVR